MKILYFVQYFPPEKASGLSLVTDMIEGFAKEGWHVIVYTTTPTRGVTDELRRLYSKKRTEMLFDGKLIIKRMPLYREGKGFLQRTIRYCIFSFQCLLKGIFVPADAIFTGGGPPTQGIVAGIIHKLTKKKVIFNPQDLFPDSLIVSGKINEKSKLIRVLRKIEKFSYDNSDKIITITEEMANNIKSKTRNKNEVYVVRNWMDTKIIKPIKRKDNKLFDELSLSRDKFYIVYAGNLGVMQSINTLVTSAIILREFNDIEIIIFGNGSEEDKIKNRIFENNLNNIKVFPLMNQDRVSEVYSLGDVSVVSCKKGTGISGMPSKTWTIMSSGRAILASFDYQSQLRKVLEESKSGYCVEPENPEELAKTILLMRKNIKETKVMGENARKYAEDNISKENSVNAYIRIIES